jgi:hypothetical protein
MDPLHETQCRAEHVCSFALQPSQSVHTVVGLKDPAAAMSNSNPNETSSWQGLAASPLEESPGDHDMAPGVDPVEAYFECITSCSLDDGECITTCSTILREHH